MNLFAAPKLPVTESQRVWTELSLDRLIGFYGEETFRAVTVLPPSDAAFPEWDGTPGCVAPLLARVCACLRAEAADLRVELVPDRQSELRRRIPQLATERSHGAAGLYRVDPESGTTICVKESLLNDPISLIATLTHEVGHVRLLGEGYIDRSEPDMEPLTDLHSVFWGMGIFTANSAFRFVQGSEGWSVSRKGYLSEEMWGYALAAWAHRRGDRDAKWQRHLCTNVRTYFRRSQDWLRRARTSEAGR